MKRASLLLWLLACGGTGGASDVDARDVDAAPDLSAGSDAAVADALAPAGARTVFVIPMENKPSSSIYLNTPAAPYINGLMSTAAYATMFMDELPSLDSEPHYLWMEAGTNAFSDITFTTDADPSASHSTASTAHLVTQRTAAGIPWMSYQEGITSGTCPIATSGEYAPKHDPFVFFSDVAGSPPSASTPGCATHHKSYADFAADLAGGQLAGYVFITPNLCHDMHGDLFCPSLLSTSANIKAGDTWLSTELPRIIAYTQTHDAVIFLTWDEGNSSNVIPFLAIGKHVHPGASTMPYSHSSLLKSVEEYLGVPVLPTVAAANDFAAMFEPGMFP